MIAQPFHSKREQGPSDRNMCKKDEGNEDNLERLEGCLRVIQGKSLGRFLTCTHAGKAEGPIYTLPVEADVTCLRTARVPCPWLLMSTVVIPVMVLTGTS